VPTVRTSFDLTQRVNSARQPNDQVPPSVSEALRGIYSRHNQELSALIGRDLSHWG
jgi:hypothetical protein